MLISSKETEQGKLEEHHLAFWGTPASGYSVSSYGRAFWYKVDNSPHHHGNLLHDIDLICFNNAIKYQLELVRAHYLVNKPLTSLAVKAFYVRALR